MQPAFTVSFIVGCPAGSLGAAGHDIHDNPSNGNSPQLTVIRDEIRYQIPCLACINILMIFLIYYTIDSVLCLSHVRTFKTLLDLHKTHVAS